MKAVPQILDYVDARLFMKNLYEYRKSHERGFSYRKFSSLAGLSSPNYLKLFIMGERNLSERMATRFALASNLVDEEVDYFEALVMYTQSDDLKARAVLKRKLDAIREVLNATQLGMSDAAYYSSWLGPAIRELVHVMPELEPAQVAKVLQPAVPKTRVERMIEVLLELELLSKSGDVYTQVNPIVRTGELPKGEHIYSFHRAMIKKGYESLDNQLSNVRDISSVTMSLNKDQLSELKKCIQTFRKKILSLSEAMQSPDAVYQINIQLFPLALTNSKKEKPCP